jgi:diadenosine tetraphosphate (Ap4A) HIT family hydrolase
MEGDTEPSALVSADETGGCAPLAEGLGHAFARGVAQLAPRMLSPEAGDPPSAVKCAKVAARKPAGMGSGSCVAASLTPARSATMQRGYTLVIRCGRQINEPAEPDGTEAVRYWPEAPAVARALIGVSTPLKVNYETIVNSLPHLHIHLLPRFPDDPHPRQPFPLTAQQPDQPISGARLLAEAAALRSLLQ